MLKTMLALILLSISGVVSAAWYEEKAEIMGTDIRVYLWHDDESKGKRAVTDVMSEFRRIDALMSTYLESSELSLINRRAAHQPVAVSDELLQLIMQALELSERTDGAFDITYASVGYLYDYRNAVRPDDATIGQRLKAVNFRHVRVDQNKRTIEFNHPDVRIDLGGIAKGYAVDRAITKLTGLAVEHAIVTAGGDTRVLGQHRDRPWVVGIQDPRLNDKVVALIPLVDESISTSGDYERYFDDNGIRYHHIIDPQTGDSARAVRSVSILGATSTLADALSTSLFVLGLDDGIEVINKIEGYEAIVVDQQGKLHYSTGLQQPEKPEGTAKHQVGGVLSPAK